MKTYQKPVMIALTLTGNEQLCGSCAKPLRPDLDKESLNSILDFFTPIPDGKLTKEEFSKLFGSDEGCDRNYIVDGYCKFSSNDIGIIVAWS